MCSLERLLFISVGDGSFNVLSLEKKIIFLTGFLIAKLTAKMRETESNLD